MEDKNIFEYFSKKYNAKYQIEVLRRTDGYFIATPLDATGQRRGSKGYQRLSAGFSVAIDSLIDEVLENTPPPQIFEN